jgi:hypothetical protein
MGVGATAMQRIRYGLTGLAFVFLAVLLGTAVIRSGEEPADNGTSVNLVEQPSEPLAELGVTPGEGSSENLADNRAGQPQR